jgi:hypothetical protein
VTGLRISMAAAVMAPMLLAAVALAQTSESESAAWIDAPLGFASLPFAPVEVVAHATDPAGVVQLRLEVDGSVVSETPADPAGDRLAVGRFLWVPAAPGVFELAVRGRPEGGDWGPAGTVEVVVVGDGTASVTTVATTSTTRPVTTSTIRVSTTTTRPVTTTSTRATTTTSISTTTTSSSTTTTLCALGLPSPAGSSVSAAGSATLIWSYSGCREPEQFELQVSRDASFARVEYGPVGVGGERSVTTPPLECGTWFWRVRTYDSGDIGPWSGASSFEVSLRGCP